MFTIPLSLTRIINNPSVQPSVTTPGVPTVRRYWPVPPVVPPVYEYQNVNKDVHLRNTVTKFFQKKVIKWINKNELPQKADNPNRSLQFIESLDGRKYIYDLLRHFVHKADINWYDLKDNYNLIKKYLIQKL
jgi:hypothetical protein